MTTIHNGVSMKLNKNIVINKITKKALITTIAAALSMSSFANTPAVDTSTSAKPATAATKASINDSTVTVASDLASSCIPGTACFVVKDTSNKAISLINNNNANQMTNVVTSQFDFNLMTRSAMGVNWKTATPKQQAKLVELFQKLLISTYSIALSKFKGAQINITEAKISDDKRKTFVITKVTLPNSDTNSNTPVKVEYDLANVKGQWKAYDIKIIDASIVSTYRTQFNDTVTNQGGIGALIKQLQAKINSLQNTKK